MAAFQDGLVPTGTFSEFDELASATAGWDLTYSQVGSGAFAGDIDFSATSRVQIIRDTWSAPLLVEGRQPGKAVSLPLVVAADCGVRWLGSDYDREATIIGGTPGHEVQFLGSGPIEIVAVSIQHGLFERHFSARFGLEGSTLGRAMDAMRRVLASGAVTRWPASVTVRRRAARSATEVLRARLDGPPSLGELCQLTRASERTLHAAFQESFGLAPMRYLRGLRLNAARFEITVAHAQRTKVKPSSAGHDACEPCRSARVEARQLRGIQVRRT